MSSCICIIYYILQTVRLKLIFVQVMCGEDNRKYTEYLVINSVRERDFKIVDITFMFCHISFCNQMIKSLRLTCCVGCMHILMGKPLLYSILHTIRNKVTFHRTIKITLRYRITISYKQVRRRHYPAVSDSGRKLWSVYRLPWLSSTTEGRCSFLEIWIVSLEMCSVDSETEYKNVWIAWDVWTTASKHWNSLLWKLKKKTLCETDRIYFNLLHWYLSI